MSTRKVTFTLRLTISFLFLLPTSPDLIYYKICNVIVVVYYSTSPPSQLTKVFIKWDVWGG